MKISGIQPVYKSIKNLHSKPCKIYWKYSIHYGIFARDFAGKYYSAPKLVSRSEAVNFHAPKLTRKFRGRERPRLRSCSKWYYGTIYCVNETRLTGWKIRFNKSVVKSFVDQLPLFDERSAPSQRQIPRFEFDHPMNRLRKEMLVETIRDCGQEVKQYWLSNGNYGADWDGAATRKNAWRVIVAICVLRCASDGSRERCGAINIGQFAGRHTTLWLARTRFQLEKVAYHKLGFAVIDESTDSAWSKWQALLEKSDFMPHLLSMTAHATWAQPGADIVRRIDISILMSCLRRQPIFVLRFGRLSISSEALWIDWKWASQRSKSFTLFVRWIDR